MFRSTHLKRSEHGVADLIYSSESPPRIRWTVETAEKILDAEQRHENEQRSNDHTENARVSVPTGYRWGSTCSYTSFFMELLLGSATAGSVDFVYTSFRMAMRNAKLNCKKHYTDSSVLQRTRIRTYDLAGQGKRSVRPP